MRYLLLLRFSLCALYLAITAAADDFPWLWEVCAGYEGLPILRKCYPNSQRVNSPRRLGNHKVDKALLRDGVAKQHLKTF